MKQLITVTMTAPEAADMVLGVSKVFRPSGPITTRELFAGRWSEMTLIADSVGQVGLHIVIYGEPGVGKSSLANVVRPVIHLVADSDKNDRVVILVNAAASDNFSIIWDKLFRSISWQKDRPVFGLARRPESDSVTVREAFNLPGQLCADDVRHVLSFMPGAVFIVDEFDRAASTVSKEFTDLIKSLADQSNDCTIILVGVSDTIDELISDHISIHRSLVQIKLPRMAPNELNQIIVNAENQLNISFTDDASNLIVRMSQGLPHYTHLLGLHAVRQAATARLSRQIELSDVFRGLKEAVKRAQQSVTGKHSNAVHSAHKDALYRQVLLACAIAASKTEDPLGYFYPAEITSPLATILNRSVQVATFNNHLAEFSGPKRGKVLERWGQPRGFRFRFRDPLLVPYVFMDAVTNEVISDDQLSTLLGPS